MKLVQIIASKTGPELSSELVQQALRRLKRSDVDEIRLYVSLRRAADVYKEVKSLGTYRLVVSYS